MIKDLLMPDTKKWGRKGDAPIAKTNLFTSLNLFTEGLHQQHNENRQKHSFNDVSQRLLFRILIQCTPHCIVDIKLTRKSQCSCFLWKEFIFLVCSDQIHLYLCISFVQLHCLKMNCANSSVSITVSRFKLLFILRQAFRPLK